MNHRGHGGSQRKGRITGIVTDLIFVHPRKPAARKFPAYAANMQFHFDAIFYYVSDLDRAIAFYTNVLGFKLASRDVVARFDVDGVLFELVPTDDQSKVKGMGNGRLCLRVEEMQAALGQLRAKGIATSGAHPKPGGVLASFYDPDGNEICLWEYAKTEDPELSL